MACSITISISTDRLNDSDGDEINSVTLNPRGGPGVTLDVDVDVDIYVLAPTLIWVSAWKILGAKYGAFITPTFANASVGASLATATGRGIDADTSQFAMGDLFVQPLWLGWTLTHWDIALRLRLLCPGRQIRHLDCDPARRHHGDRRSGR